MQFKHQTNVIGQIPANWINSNPIINSAPSTFKELQEKNEKIKNEKNGISWYLNFQNNNEPKKIQEKN